MTLLDQVLSKPLPKHVAIVMDGNGRWAKARGLPRTAGHRAGAEVAEWIIRFAAERLNLGHLTLFAFSAENWSRPRDEVAFLMDLLEEFIREKRDEFVDAGIRLHVAGDVDALPEPLGDVVRRVVDETAGGKELQLTVAINYGGRQDLVAAARRLAAEVRAGSFDLEEIGEDAIAARLQTAGVPDPDLVIRTSGEMRLSNFLLWQSAYAEFDFVNTLWPDFTPATLLHSIAEYQRRNRRFGGLEEDGT